MSDRRLFLAALGLALAIVASTAAAGLASWLILETLRGTTKVTWVLGRASGITSYVLLLTLVATGLVLSHPKRKDECCGFGGTFCVFEEAVSVKMGKDRVAEHEANEVEYITGVDVSCLMHMEGILKRKGSNIKAIHIAEILNAV